MYFKPAVAKCQSLKLILAAINTLHCTNYPNFPFRFQHYYHGMVIRLKDKFLFPEK